MKKIIALLAIVVASFSAKAGSVVINNMTSMPLTGRIGGQIIGYPSMTGGFTWYAGGTIVTIPAMGITFPDVASFYSWSTGGASLPLPAPMSMWYLWAANFTPVGGWCGTWAMQDGASHTYSACTTFPFGYTVSMYQTSPGNIQIDIM